jgi:hypothetical protein
MGQNRYPAAGALRPVTDDARLGWMGRQIVLDVSPGKPMEYIWQAELTLTLSLRWADGVSLRSRKF